MRARTDGGRLRGRRGRGGDCDSADARPDGGGGQTFRPMAVRYQVADVDRAVAFYVDHLGFEPGQQSGSAFAMVSNGPLVLYLSGPGSSGSRPMPDGSVQRPGGWNRIVLGVTDLPARVEALRRVGVRFRGSIVAGPGGRQIQVEDPDGNPVELFEPAERAPTGPRPPSAPPGVP